jgi:DsbC/DsbD-like thiol-disulfide interchange protein
MLRIIWSAPALLLATMTLPALAAPKPPVHWQVKAAPSGAVKPGGRFQVIVAGQIDPGWHMYALEEPQGGPIATEVAIAEGDPADLLRVNESRPEVILDPMFGLTTGLFRQNVAFTLKLQMPRGEAAGPQPLHVLVRYQACNDHVCLPPHTDTVDVPLSVGR